MKKRGLGKGLSELGVSELLTTTLAPDEPLNESELTKLPVIALQPGRYQPRRHIDDEALFELAESIRAQGIIQPIVVRKVADGYEIIAGERRWRAAKLANLEHVPVVVRDLSDESALAMSLIENIQRQDLNAIEEAEALQRLLNEFEMTHQQVAKAVGKSRASVTNLLRLLKLSAYVRNLVEQGKLEMGHARALLALDDEKQRDIANIFVARALSVREAEKFIRQLQEKQQPEVKKENLLNSDLQRLQTGLVKKLNTQVTFKQGANGHGKLVIQYKSLVQLDEILSRIH